MDAGAVPQSRVRFSLVPECALQSIRIESQNNLTSIEALCVRIANVDRGHEKDADFVHESRVSGFSEAHRGRFLEAIGACLTPAEPFGRRPRSKQRRLD